MRKIDYIQIGGNEDEYINLLRKEIKRKENLKKKIFQENQEVIQNKIIPKIAYMDIKISDDFIQPKSRVKLVNHILPIEQNVNKIDVPNNTLSLQKIDSIEKNVTYASNK